MSASLEITAAEFVQGCERQKLFGHKKSFNTTNRLLWGAPPRTGVLRMCGKGNPLKFSVRSSAQSVSGIVDKELLAVKPTAEVIHFFRVPLIQESATAELLKQAQTKISSLIVGLKTEQCFCRSSRS